MAMQGKVLQRLCHSLWRVSVSCKPTPLAGNSGHANILHQPSPPCRLQRLSTSSSPSQLTHLHSTPTTSLPPPPCLHVSEKSSFNVSLHKNFSIAGSSAVENSRYTHHQKGARTSSLNSISNSSGSSSSSNISGLHLHEADRRCQPAKKSWNLATWPDRDHTEYICPSEKLTTLPELVILEPLPSTLPYELPQTSNSLPHIIDPTSATTSTEISEPTDTGTRNTPKEARKIMKIRRKKMKRHLLKKFRKRMAFTLRKIKRERRKKKEAVFQARLSQIRDWGESFNAWEWVQDHLNKARKGGFYINVLEKQQQKQGK